MKIIFKALKIAVVCVISISIITGIKALIKSTDKRKSMRYAKKIN